jgi:hypothetical protein
MFLKRLQNQPLSVILASETRRGVRMGDLTKR